MFVKGMYESLRCGRERPGKRNVAGEVRVSVSAQMPVDSVQLQMVRRYARILREQQAQYRGPRIGARERRAAKEAVRSAVDAVKPTKQPT